MFSAIVPEMFLLCLCNIVSITLSVDKQNVVQSLSLFVLTKNRIRSPSTFSMYFRVITSCIVKYSKDSWKGPQFSLKLFSIPFKQASANVHKSWIGPFLTILSRSCTTKTRKGEAITWCNCKWQIWGKLLDF